jgi:tape measure domain-containing protein
MATVVTGLAATLSLDSKSYIAGLNAAAIATQRAQSQMMRSYASATAAAQQSTVAIQRQAAVANTAARQMNTSFMSLGRSVTSFANSFKSLLAVGLVMQSAKTLADYSDTWMQLNNQVKAAESISGRTSEGLTKIFEIAQRTRVPIADLGDLYSKMVRVSGDLGVGMNQVAKATEITAQAFKAGGASTLEQVNGIRQLIQALGSGILQGDELRSIRENAPLLAKAIANEFGVTVAGLKALGAEGKLTSDRVFKAIIDGQSTIGPAFAATNSTIAESFTILNNAVTQYIGVAGQSSGASSAIAQGVIRLADNLPKVSAEFKSNFLFIGLQRMSSALKFIHDAALEAADTLGLLPDKIQAINNTVTASTPALFTYAGILKDVNNYGGAGGVQTTSVSDMITKATADRQDAMGMRVMGPEQGLDFEKIASNAVAAEAAVSKLKTTQSDWATQTTVTDAGRLQADAYKHLAEYIKDTETPFETYKRTLAEVAILERDGALTATQAFTARSQSMLTFANTALGAASAMTGALTQLFKDNKAVAIANAVINTAEAITSALKNPPGPPFSYVYAAAAAVAGAAQISTILSTNPGSGNKTPTVKSGGGKSAASSATSDAGKAARSSSGPSQAVTINVTGESFGPEHFRKLVNGLNAVIADGATLRVQ